MFVHFFDLSVKHWELSNIAILNFYSTCETNSCCEIYAIITLVRIPASEAKNFQAEVDDRLYSIPENN